MVPPPHAWAAAPHQIVLQWEPSGDTAAPPSLVPGWTRVHVVTLKHHWHPGHIPRVDFLSIWHGVRSHKQPLDSNSYPEPWRGRNGSQITSPMAHSSPSGLQGARGARLGLEQRKRPRVTSSPCCCPGRSRAGPCRPRAERRPHRHGTMRSPWPWPPHSLASLLSGGMLLPSWPVTPCPGYLLCAL